ncbi:MAG: hypothetical protein ACRDTJ_29230 [Pseudonocardiaceae bacterium]
MSSSSNLTDRDLLIAVHTNVETLVKASDDHEARIRRLERWQYIATGLAAAAGSGVGAGIASVLNR